MGPVTDRTSNAPIPSPDKGADKENVVPKDVLKDAVRPHEEQLPSEGSQGVSTASPRTFTNQITAKAADVDKVAAVQLGVKKEVSQATMLLDSMESGVFKELGAKKPNKDIVLSDEGFIKSLGLGKTDRTKVGNKAYLLSRLAQQRDLSPGRRLLLEDFIKYPNQIIQDVDRITNLTIGGEKIELEQKGAEAVIDLGTKLLEYIESKNDNLQGVVSWQVINEVVSAYAQNFSTPPAERQHEDPIFSKDKSGASFWAKKDQKMSVSFQMEDSADNIKVTRTCSMTCFHINDEHAPEKKLNYSTTFDYNLKSKDVTVTYVYELDGQKVSWKHPDAPPPYPKKSWWSR